MESVCFFWKLSAWKRSDSVEGETTKIKITWCFDFRGFWLESGSAAPLSPPVFPRANQSRGMASGSSQHWLAHENTGPTRI